MVDIYTDSKEPKYNIGNGIDNSVKTICTLHVPIGCKANYKANASWNTFKDIVEYDARFALIYMLDGKEYYRGSVEYGAKIKPLAEPTRKGYSFSGWSYIPATMPAADVVIAGSFIVNGINGVEENGTKLVAYFTISGKKLDKPQRGLNIVRMSDGTVRKVMY